MNMRGIEIVVGLFVILAFLALGYMAVKVSGLESFSRGSAVYHVYADFSDIGSLKVGAPVKVAGVKVGQVSAVTLDPASFQAHATFAIADKFSDLPVDSAASIYTQGILGSNYISLDPGFSTESLKNGMTITTTHSALILEQLIGQLLYQFKSSDKDKASS